MPTPDAAATEPAAPGEEAAWQAVLAARRAARGGRRPPFTVPLAAGRLRIGRDGRWSTGLALAEGGARVLDLYLPFALLPPERDHAVAHLGQSLDGRIATLSGASRWITGGADILHTHRMRALADAVIVGANTIACDDPLLTVRHCPGDSPARVVIDPSGSLPARRQVFDGAARTLCIVGAAEAPPARGGGAVERIALPRREGRIAAAAIRAALAERGLRHLFIEGGGLTVSAFLADGALDRLQVTVAPLIIGSGRPAIVLPEIAEPARGLRPRTRRFALGDDIMVECIFRD